MEHGNKNSAVSNIADQINDAKWKMSIKWNI